MNATELIAAQVRQSPGSIAMTDGELAVSYAQLWARSGRLARYLSDRGAGPGSWVVLALPLSAEFIVTMLAVLRSGAVCVPADVTAPTAFLPRTEALTCVLTTVAAARGWPATGPAPVLVDDPELLDALDAMPSSDPGEPARAPLASAAPAQVQLTSAGAGEPVGVLITHGSLAAAVASITAIRPDHSLVASGVPVAADPAPAALLAALSVGATLLVCSPAEAADGGLRPGSLRMPADSADRLALLPADAVPTDELILYGDSVSGPALARWKLRHRTVSVTKEYGWAETTGSCARLDLAAERSAGQVTAVGRPVPGARIVLLDRDGHRVRRGQAGEACVGGDLVAAGYAGLPDLTRRRFVADPARPGSRLFRTGDLMRRRADGMLELVGCLDQHVKIGGMPVAPVDIETALLRHPATAAAEVVLDAPSRTIAARVVPVPGFLVKHAEAAAERDALSRWREVYDSLYAGPPGPAGADFSGWTSCYDGAPIPVGQMREWRDATIDRIRTLRPRRVLEIGVGTGLLFTRLFEQCEQYWATDLSAAALDRVAAGLARHDPRVVLRHQTADDMTGLPVRFFDTVMLNSVVQYFPGEAYLARVIAGLSRLLAPGGAIFIGDVRNLRLDRGLRDEIQLTRGVAADRGTELLIDPDYFAAWAASDPGCRTADIRIKRGRFRNELTRYRYDVILRHEPAPAAAEAVHLDWHADVGSAAGLDRQLRARRGTAVQVSGIPNGRLARSGEPDPERLCVLGEQHGHRPLATWTGDSAEGAIDIAFRPAGDPWDIAPYRAGPAGTWPLTNAPSSGGSTAESLSSALRDYVMGQLPAYLVPEPITVVSRPAADRRPA